MNARTSRGVLVVMASVGWMLACVFGVLACLLAADSHGRDAPWQILAALVLGSMLTTIPVGAILFAAFRAFGGTPPSERLSPAKASRDNQPNETSSWQWPTFAVLCGLELLVVPLTLVAAAADDDTLLLSIPFNLALLTAALLVACWPHRQRASIVICTVHLTGIVIATFAAAMEIESVVVSGLLLLISGTALALVGTRPQMTRILFALSTVVFIMTSFLVIAIGRVGEHEAEAPLFAAMVAYQIVFVPIGLWQLYCALCERKVSFRPQFGLKQLIAVMMIVSLASALARLAYSEDDDVRVAVALGLGALVIAGIGAAIGAGGWAKWSDHKLRRQETRVV